jgi:hypothetical protein
MAKKLYISILIFILIIFFQKKKKLNNNYKVIGSIKTILSNKIKEKFNKNITYMNSLYITGGLKFGNFLISLNNAIIFCELFHYKRIIIENNKLIFIKNKLFFPKYNLAIEPNHTINNSLNIDVNFFYYRYFRLLGKVNKYYLFRDEIMKNLPKTKTHPKDLYIYLRGGDIFMNLKKTNPNYPQPPFCFYENILSKFKFRKSIIISEDQSNPLFQKLIYKYPYIKFNKKDIKNDISYLANSYNIVSAVSSFIITIIKLNYKLKFLWEYDFYKLSERYLHYHHSVYNFSFNYFIYKMKVSENYKKIMLPYNNTDIQIKLMIEEKCDNNFSIIPPRIL